MATILSIQSHVVYGFAGNRMAVFPLERLGHTVYPIHTVQFSNHTGYGQWKGQVFTADHIAELLEGIEARGALTHCNAVLSGYLGDASIGEQVLSAVARCRKANPKALYVCDPVMGDVGRGVFVRPAITDFMRHPAVTEADIITPNHFEMELLVGHSIDSLEAAQSACEIVAARSLRLRCIVITSLRCPDRDSNQLDVFMWLPEHSCVVTTPYLHFAHPVYGTGDLFSALFLGYYLARQQFVWALEYATSAIFAILDHTAKQGAQEVALIEAQQAIIAPPVLFPAVKVVL